jgi:hypothetical protein
MILIAPLAVLITALVSRAVARGRDEDWRTAAGRRCRYAALGLGSVGVGLTEAATVDNERTSPRVRAALIPLALCAVPTVAAFLGRAGFATGIVTWLAFAVLFAFVVIASMSVGLFYLPADLALLAAAILGGGGSRHRERREPTSSAVAH